MVLLVGGFAAAVFPVASACVLMTWSLAPCILLTARPFVEPGLWIVFLRRLVPTRPDAFVDFRVEHVFAKDYGSVGVIHHVVAEDLVVRDRVVHDPAKEQDVRAGAERNPDIRGRGGSRIARIDVDD